MLRQRHIPLKNEKEPPKERLLFVLFHVEQSDAERRSEIRALRV